MNGIEQRCLAATLKLKHAIEESAYYVCLELDLPADARCIDAAERAMVDQSPLFVASIELHGQTSWDQYEQHPGHAFYRTNRCVERDAPPYCGLESAKSLGLQWLREQWEAIRAEDERRGETEYDGRYFPERVVLLDQFGNVLQEYAPRYLRDGMVMRWLDEELADVDCNALLAQASELQQEASQEFDRDNFETAKNLRHRAVELSRKAHAASARARVIH